MRYAKDHKTQTRARVVETAARALRRDGIDGIGLAGLMAEAGLTKGGFYAHFTSKDALVGEAVATSLQASAERMRLRGDAAAAEGGVALVAIVDAYLDLAHVSAPETGCTIGALLSELSRGGAPVLAAAAAGAAQLIAAIEAALPETLGDQRHAKAGAILGLLAGCLQLARLEPTREARLAILACAKEAVFQLADLRSA